MQNIQRRLSEIAQRTHNAARDESGQALILLVFLLTVMFVMGAIVFDAGLAMSEKERLQTATDAAALAGAQSKAKGASDAGAQLAACNRFKDNGYDSSSCQTDCTPSSGENCVNIPPLYGAHVGNSAYVEVIGSHDSLATFLSAVTSTDKFTPEARSVAGYASGGAGYGIFAYVTNPPTNCTPPEVNFPAHNVEFSGSNADPIVINGDLRTNGSLWIGGQVVFPPGTSVTYGCQIGPLNNIPDNAVQVPGSEPFPPTMPVTLQGGSWVSTEIQDKCASNDPDVYRITTGAISGANPAVDQNGIARFHDQGTNNNQNSVFEPGVYCFTGPISIPTRVEGCSDVPPAIVAPCQSPGGVTFAAMGANGRISGGGSCGSGAGSECSVLSPYFNNVLMYAEGTGNSALTPTGCSCNGRRVNYAGILAAPNGRLNPNGGNINFNGGWMANTILITAGNITINANGALGSGGVKTTLVE